MIEATMTVKDPESGDMLFRCDYKIGDVPTLVKMFAGQVIESISAFKAAGGMVTDAITESEDD